MIDQEALYARFKDAKWAQHTDQITVGGAGGLGSWLAMNLSRIGHRIMCYDMDSVGQENIGGGQLYKQSQIGTKKTEALRENIWDFCGSNNFDGLDRFEKGDPVNNICFTTFDNMESRKDMFETWLEKAMNKPKDDPSIYLFVNISMLPEGGFIETVDRPSRAKLWIDYWEPSSAIADLPCSFKSTTHNASLMANLAVAILNNVIFNKMIGSQLRYVPYRTSVDLNLLTFEYNETNFNQD